MSAHYSILEVFINGSGGLAARTHGKDDGGGTADGIAARENAGTGRGTAFIGHETASPRCLQASGSA